MLNELEEFKAYTGPVEYTAAHKRDTAFLGRFTFESLMELDGLGRILTVLARGYLPDIDRARDALRAWCSIPDSKKATPGQEWRSRTDHRELHEVFPELVDENGAGWFYRHVHRAAAFVLEHPDRVRKGYGDYARAIQRKFDAMWRSKVVQFQVPIFSLTTKGAWTLRFDDILADALEQGPLRNYETEIPEKLLGRIEKLADKKAVPYIRDVLAWCQAHKEDDCGWVVLPVASFDMYYGSSYFSKRILPTIPEEILERQTRMGICRCRVREGVMM